MCLIRMIIHSDRKMASERRIRIFVSSVFFFNESILVDDATLCLQRWRDFQEFSKQRKIEISKIATFDLCSFPSLKLFSRCNKIYRVESANLFSSEATSSTYLLLFHRLVLGGLTFQIVISLSYLVKMSYLSFRIQREPMFYRLYLLPLICSNVKFSIAVF